VRAWVEAAESVEAVLSAEAAESAESVESGDVARHRGRPSEAL